MSAIPKDLNYYLSHTDEMPTDPKEIEALANAHMAAALESGGEQLTVDRFVEKDEKAESSTAAKPGDEKPDDKAKADADAAAKADADAKAEVDAKAAADKEAADKAAAGAKPDGILAKDGKNVIPYSQLESARDRARAAEELAEQLRSENEKLKAGAAKPADQPDASMLTEEELKQLESDSPTLAKVLRSTQAETLALRGEVKALKDHQQTQVAQEVADVKSEIQTAIDATPQLAVWQTAEDQSMWQKASAFDRVLRELPEYRDVPFEDRFKKVVALTQAATGQEEAPKPKDEPKQLTQEEIKAAAEAKLKAKPGLPKSLSDIPGGAPPAVDERERVEQASSVELGNKFLGMTKEQLDTYLASL